MAIKKKKKRFKKTTTPAWKSFVLKEISFLSQEHGKHIQWLKNACVELESKINDLRKNVTFEVSERKRLAMCIEGYLQSRPKADELLNQLDGLLRQMRDRQMGQM